MATALPGRMRSWWHKHALRWTAGDHTNVVAVGATPLTFASVEVVDNDLIQVGSCNLRSTYQ
jgi:hypothetical protein